MKSPAFIAGLSLSLMLPTFKDMAKLPTICGIYKITSPSGRIYIGQSRNIAKRKYSYKTGKCEGQILLHRSIKKYGFDNHSFEILIYMDQSVDQCILDKQERFFISDFRDKGFDLLNLRDGGRYYGTNTKETKAKISETLRKKKIVPPSRLGSKLSEDHRLILINSRKGKKNSDYHRMRLSLFNSNRPPEYYKNLLEANKKTWTIYRDGVLLGKFSSAQAAADFTGRTKASIFDICSRQAKGAKNNKRSDKLKITNE